MPSGRCTILLLCLILGTSQAAHSKPTPSQYKFCAPNTAIRQAKGGAHHSSHILIVLAKKAILKRQGISIFSGKVDATKGQKHLRSDLLHYNRSRGIATATGHVTYIEPGLQINAPYGQYDFSSDSGSFQKARYTVPKRHGHGTAREIQTFGSGRSKLSDFTYTTCPSHNVSWRLHASSVLLNETQDVGYAHNVWLSFKGVPFLWSPYLSFPISGKRKSGFLFPSISENSGNGFDLELPYYWNIKPNMDMTITPRLMTRRGLMLLDTYRFLLPGTRGQFHFSYLPHDRVAGRSRGLAQLNDETAFNSHWSIATSLEYVSDPYYFQDFGTSLRQVSQTYQRRQLTATYRVPAGKAFITFEELAPLDPAITPQASPYRKLPEIGLNLSWPDYESGLTVGLTNDLTRFQAPEKQDAIREILTPNVSEHFGGASWHITPRLALQTARYRLGPFGGQPSETLSRTAPILSINAGYLLERSLGRSGWLTQTLEPELFYLYVPYRNQSSIPIFDTYQPPLDFEQLFSTNRFVGADRLGDANQLTLALRSRVINSTNGTQLMSFGLGQILYFKNREVTLPGQSPATTARSDYVGEVSFNLNQNLYARIVGDYNPYNHQFNQAYLSFQYRRGPYRVVNIGYLYRQGQLNQTDISFAWPIGGQWSIFGRWNYSILDHQTIETMAGLQYNTCCWRFRIAQRRFVTFTGEGSSAIFFELQLKGLSSLGDRLSGLLHDDIFGYGKPD